MDRNSVFVTKLKEFKTKDGRTFLAGNIGLAGMVLFQHKTNEGEWNLFIQENKREQKPQGTHSQSGGGYAGPSNADIDNTEVPF